jgi:hypothetical protein
LGEDFTIIFQIPFEISYQESKLNFVIKYKKECRPGKNVRCSSDPGYGFGNVPQFNFQNVFNTLKISNKNLPKEAK